MGFWNSAAEWGRIYDEAHARGKVHRIPVDIKCKNCLFLSIFLSLEFISINGESFFVMVIHERKQDQEELNHLRRNSNNYNTLFHNKNIGIAYCKTVFDKNGSCSSGQDFAAGFLQIPPREGHPCLWLMIPTAKFIADFHRQVIAHAGRTSGKRLSRKGSLF